MSAIKEVRMHLLERVQYAPQRASLARLILSGFHQGLPRQPKLAAARPEEVVPLNHQQVGAVLGPHLRAIKFRLFEVKSENLNMEGMFQDRSWVLPWLSSAPA